MLNHIFKGKQWIARKIEDNYIINLVDQSDMKEALIDFITDQNIKGGEFSGIGFLDEVILNCFDPVTEQYNDEKFPGLIVVFDLQGSISEINNQLSFDFHISFKLNDKNFFNHQLINGKVHEKIDLIFYSSGDQKINFTNKIPNLNLNDFSYN